MVVISPEWIWTNQGLRRDACIVVDSHRRIRIERRSDHPSVDVRLPGRLVIPGLVNAHSHAFQRAFRGLVQWSDDSEDTFWTWRNAMYQVAAGLDPTGVNAVSALAFLEMAQAGVTHVGEFHYLHHQPDGTPYDNPDELAHAVIAAAHEVGVRITLLRVAYARGGAQTPVSGAQRRFADASPEDVLAAVQRLASAGFERCDVGLAPHSVRAVPDSWLNVFRAHTGVMHAHVSEQPGENRSCVEEHGVSPLALFERSGLLNERFTAVHLTFPMDGDNARLQRSGARVCVCPTTEMDLGDGFLPVSTRQAAPLCLGSDSQARIDLLGEARTLEWHARALVGRRNVLTERMGDRHALAERLLGAASLEGARALGVEQVGIADGHPADFVAIDLDRAAADGVPPLEAAAFNADPGWVTDVWVDGRRIVREGNHLRSQDIRTRVAALLS